MSVTRGQGNVRNLLFTHLWSAGSAGIDAVATPPEWMADGLCAQVDPELFFPEKGGSTKEAKSVCRACPVRSECLEYALERDERFGVYGGLSERERRKLNRQRHPERVSHNPCERCGLIYPTPHGLRVHLRSHGAAA